MRFSPTAPSRYVRGGTTTVTLTATSDTRQTSTSSRTITVATSLAPTAANFVFSPTNPAINQDVVFTASGTPLPGGPGLPVPPRDGQPGAPAQGTGYAWDFGDGTTGSGMNPVHVYSRERTYTVTMTVRNSLGQAATTSKIITVADTDTD